MLNRGFQMVLGLGVALAAAGCGADKGQTAFKSDTRGPSAAVGAHAQYPATPNYRAAAPAYAHARPSANPAARPAPQPVVARADQAVQIYPPPAGANGTRFYPVAVQAADANGRVVAAAVTQTIEYDAMGRPVIVQTLPPSCPGPGTASGQPGEAVWIGCGLPPVGSATLPPIMSDDVRRSLGIRRPS